MPGVEGGGLNPLNKTADPDPLTKFIKVRKAVGSTLTHPCVTLHIEHSLRLAEYESIMQYNIGLTYFQQRPGIPPNVRGRRFTYVLIYALVNFNHFKSIRLPSTSPLKLRQNSDPPPHRPSRSMTNTALFVSNMRTHARKQVGIKYRKCYR